MQGRGPGNSPPRAKTATTINGTAEARILKRNMTRSLDDKPSKRKAYGWRSVNETRSRLFDMARPRTTPPINSGGAPEVFGECAIGQGFRQMQPADLFRAIEVGARAGDAQHAMIAARRKTHGLGSVAEQF